MEQKRKCMQQSTREDNNEGCWSPVGPRDEAGALEQRPIHHPRRHVPDRTGEIGEKPADAASRATENLEGDQRTSICNSKLTSLGRVGLAWGLGSVWVRSG